MFQKTITIGKRKIGEHAPVFIIAEIGINHQGSVAVAKKMIDAIVASGADAVKFQAFRADEFISDKQETYTYKSQGKNVTESMYAMFKRYEFSEKDFRELFAYCAKKKILCFATPQNVSDMRMLLKLKVPLLKVGSDDLTNLPLLRDYARTGLPVIISTGMADFADVQDAVEVFKKEKNMKLAVLHCVSSYPAEAHEVNMRRMATIRDSFGVISGFSDHTAGIAAAITATALGAKILEKHITLDKNMAGPDHRFSADPKELAVLVAGVRFAEQALGTPEIRPSKKELAMRTLARRSIVARTVIGAGEKITEDMIEYKRPGTGLMPKYTSRVVGKRAKRRIQKGQLITLKTLL